MRNAIILAAGKGTRMKSDKSKVMHTIIDRPMLQYIVEACQEAGADRIVVIAGYQAQNIQDAYPQLEYAIQEPQLGTGHAVMQATMLEGQEGDTLVINGDGPCIQPETIKALFEANKGASLTLLSSILTDGAHYGRVVRDEEGNVTEIREAKDCDDELKKIKEINAGIYCFNNKALFEGLKELKTDNAQHEYYLTDLVKILNGKGKKVNAIPVSDPDEVMGINDCVELHEAYKWMTEKINKYWMKNGVQIVDPARTVIGKDVVIGHDVIIYPNTSITGNSRIGDYCQILSGSDIINSHIEEDCIIDNSKIEDSFIEEGLVVGPMVYVKEGQIAD